MSRWGQWFGGQPWRKTPPPSRLYQSILVRKQIYSCHQTGLLVQSSCYIGPVFLVLLVWKWRVWECDRFTNKKNILKLNLSLSQTGHFQTSNTKNTAGLVCISYQENAESVPKSYLLMTLISKIHVNCVVCIRFDFSWCPPTIGICNS